MAPGRILELEDFPVQGATAPQYRVRIPSETWIASAYFPPSKRERTNSGRYFTGTGPVPTKASW